MLEPPRVPALPAVLSDRRMRFLSVKYSGRLNYLWGAVVLAENPEGFVWYAPGGERFVRPTHTHRTRYDWIGVNWHDRWYSVTASFIPPHKVAGAPGRLHHYYCNIAAPGSWADEQMYRYVDLDLDVYVHRDGRVDLLDEDEFEFHRRRFGYPRDVVAATRRAAREVEDLARAGLPPFDGSLAAFHRALYALGA